jgi:hypothetical protein
MPTQTEQAERFAKITAFQTAYVDATKAAARRARVHLQAYLAHGALAQIAQYEIAATQHQLAVYREHCARKALMIEAEGE